MTGFMLGNLKELGPVDRRYRDADVSSPEQSIRPV